MVIAQIISDDIYNIFPLAVEINTHSSLLFITHPIFLDQKHDDICTHPFVEDAGAGWAGQPGGK